MADMETRGWQPIETAPRDGTRMRYKRVIDGQTLFHGVTAWRENVSVPPVFGAYGEVLWSATAISGWMHPDWPKRTPEPTHWMPLPQPPEAEK